MTFFGKIIAGILFLIVGGAVFHGVTTYVNNDGGAVVTEPVVISTSTIPVITVATTTPIEAASTTASTTPVQNQKKVSFVEFMKQGGSYKCSVVQTVATMTSNGTVYIHDNKIRANFTTSIQNNTIETNMIVKEGYSYSWTNMSKGVGTKVKIAPKSNPGSDAAVSATYTWNGSQVGDYNCEEWVADDTMFSLPTTVTFSAPR